MALNPPPIRTATLPLPISSSPRVLLQLQTQRALLVSKRDTVPERLSSSPLSTPPASSAPSTSPPSDQSPKTSTATNYHPHTAPHSKTAATSPPTPPYSIRFPASHPRHASETLPLLTPMPVSTAQNYSGPSAKSGFSSK